MRWLLALAVLPLLAADESRLFYSKSFPGSAPRRTSRSPSTAAGNAVYKEAADDDQPLLGFRFPKATPIKSSGSRRNSVGSIVLWKRPSKWHSWG